MPTCLPHEVPSEDEAHVEVGLEHSNAEQVHEHGEHLRGHDDPLTLADLHTNLQEKQRETTDEIHAWRVDGPKQKLE